MASASPPRQLSSSGAIYLELGDKLAMQRSLQDAVEDIKVKLQSKDCFVKATVSDPAELMRQQALSSCNSPPSDWRDHKKPSVLHLWNAYWEKDAYSKREGQCFFYRSYTGLTRNTGWVKSATFSPDGTKLVSCANMNPEHPLHVDTTLRVWDAMTGECQKVLQGPDLAASTSASAMFSAMFSSAMFSPDGKKVVSTTPNDVQVWDANTSERVKVLNVATGHVMFARFLTCGTKLVVVSSTNGAASSERVCVTEICM